MATKRSNDVAAWTATSRRKQGLSPKVTDAGVINRLASLVTLSKRSRRRLSASANSDLLDGDCWTSRVGIGCSGQSTIRGVYGE